MSSRKYITVAGLPLHTAADPRYRDAVRMFAERQVPTVAMAILRMIGDATA